MGTPVGACITPNPIPPPPSHLGGSGDSAQRTQVARLMSRVIERNAADNDLMRGVVASAERVVSENTHTGAAPALRCAALLSNPAGAIGSATL